MDNPSPTSAPSPTSSPFIQDENRLLDRLMQGQLIGVSYHPVVDLTTRTVFAYEALCRPKDGYFRTPEELLESAVRGGRMGELGRHLREIAIAKCLRWPLFLNLDPHEFAAEYLVRPDDPVFLHGGPVYLEISETVPIDFSEDCASVLAEIRKKGVLLSIDDFGAGSSSLKNIAELRPDIVKLDRELVMNCLPGSREFDLLRAVTDLCHRMGAKVIAEGIETPDELKSVIAAGLDYGQGFLLSLPQDPPPPFFWPPEVPRGRDAYLREFSSSEAALERSPELDDTLPPPAASEQAPAPCSAESKALEEAKLAIDRLQAELDETRTELEETRQERSLFADKLRRLAHAPSASSPRREKVSTTSKPVTVTLGSVPQTDQPNEVDALEFLQQLEEGSARIEEPE